MLLLKAILDPSICEEETAPQWRQRDQNPNLGGVLTYFSKIESTVLNLAEGTPKLSCRFEGPTEATRKIAHAAIS